MTKQDYLSQRTHNRIDLRLAWEMYISVLQNNPPISWEVFTKLLPIYIDAIRGSMTEYWRWCDQKFGVNMLTKKDGNVLFY